MLPPWAGRNYTIQTAATVITSLGNAGAMIAAAFAVLDAGGSGTDVGLTAAARTLPLVVFLLVGGAVADRISRARLMALSNTANALSQGLFGVLILSGVSGIWWMWVLSAVGGAAHAFYAPAAEGVLLSSVKGADAGKAFAVFRIGMSGATIGGAALGGALTAVIGPGWVLATDAVALAFAAFLRVFMRTLVLERTEQTGMLQDLKDGWREVASRPWLWGIILQFSVIVGIFVATESVYGPMIAKEHLGGSKPWGFALAAFGVGTVLGALVMMRWKPRRMLLVATLCVFPMALTPMALAVPTPWPVIAVGMFIGGVGLEIFGVNWMLALHQEIPEDKLGRVSAYDWFGSVSLTPLATALSGPAADTFGMTPVLWGCAALVVVLTAAVLVLPDVRNLVRRTDHKSVEVTPEPVAA
jgi:MFS family permease